MKAIGEDKGEAPEFLKKKLLRLVRQYAQSVPNAPSRRSNYTARQHKMALSTVAVYEFGEILFLYDSLCETRSIEHLFKQFRQFHDGKMRDYALVATADSSIGVLDLFTGSMIASTQLCGYTNWEFHVPKIGHLLTPDNIGTHLERGYTVRTMLSRSFDPSDQDMVQWMKNEIEGWKRILAQSTALLGNDGFASVIKTDSNPLENVLLRLNLSKVSEGTLEVCELGPKIALVPWVPLDRSLGYSLNAPGELTVVQEATYRLKKIW